MGDGSYFSQVKRSEREADRLAVPSILFVCQCSNNAIQLTVVPTGSLHPVTDQLSASPTLSSDATVATGNHQSVATHLTNAVHTHAVTPKCEGKSVRLQAWSGPEGSRKLRFPDFMTTAQGVGKVVSFTHRPHLPPGNSPGTHFC